METKHTSGEWECVPDEYRPFEYRLTSKTEKGILVPTKSESEANAKLIAAAPELLEALIYLTSRVRLDLLPESVSLKITNAINKATK